MTFAPSPPDEDASGETASLIKTLRQIDQRLDELLSGEVDSVTDHQGRSFLLHRSQREQRIDDAAKQAAILNALPADIVLLDTHGRIVMVNEAWRRLARANLLRNPEYGIGVDYLAVCDAARGDDQLDAFRAAAGIRAVLAGRTQRFSMEYPCKTPAGQLCFLLAVTPLNDGQPTGAVVMHVNITEQKRAEEALVRFAAAMDATMDGIHLIDRETLQFVHINDAACRLRCRTREELFAMGPAAAFSTPPAELARRYDALIAGGVAAQPAEMLMPRADGSHHWIETRTQAQRLGGRWTIVTQLRDVTERKEAEKRIGQLNRVHAMLSGINALIVRVRDRNELFDETCRIANKEGGFPLVWIGLLDPGGLRMTPVASVGADHELLDFISYRLSFAEGSTTRHALMERAIRERSPVVVNDIQSNVHIAFRAKYVTVGLRSLAILPLVVSGAAVGALVLYARESEFFHSDELKLLTGLAGDVAFAIDHIERQERLHFLAYYDVLTGLANRTLFLDRLAQHMRSAAVAAHPLALFLVDLERFKNFNDTLGRAAGDALLIQVAKWLTRNSGDPSLVARLGADHFAVVMPAITREGDLARLVEKTLEVFVNHPFKLEGVEYRLAIKVGVALFPDDGNDADALFRNAEAALKKAKTGGDRYLFYAEKMTDTVAGRLGLENQLRQALKYRQFVLHYQPKVSLVTGKITGAEALLRWNDPQSGLVPPGKFIPVLEEIGLIHAVGRWALGQAVEDYLRWRRAGLTAVRVAVNVSPLQLRHRGFVREIEQVMAVDPFAAEGLELEITESLIMEDVKHSIASLRAVREMGVTIAVDDFGTGFSSLSYLAKLPVTTLKIDRSFVLEMTAGPDGLALVSTIINLAHSLRLNVVAEGVETEEQSRLLRLLNCDEIQGHVFSEPVSGEVFETLFLRPPQSGAA